MGREGAELIRDGLLVSDIRQNLIEHWHRCFLRRYGNSRLRHHRKQPHRFQHNGLATGIWTADDEDAPRSIQIERHWKDLPIHASKIVFQQWMTGLDQAQQSTA